MFHIVGQGQIWALVGVGLLTGCVLGEHVAEAPVDGAAAAADAAAATGDAAADASSCQEGADSDGDGVGDCAEADDGDPFTDPEVFNGLVASIGERPEVTGSCGALDDYAEMTGRFDSPSQSQPVYAGWEFDTGADSYDDPSYGFLPNWPSADGGRFSVRYHGRIALAAGQHCFSIDIGATGTGIIDGKNGCGQVYVGVDGAPAAALAETGYSAETAGPATGCVDMPAAGDAQLDIVFWYFNVFEQAILRVRHCSGAGCTPSQPIAASTVQAR